MKDFNLLDDIAKIDAPDPYDWFQAVPEAHDLSGAAAARYMGKILHAPVAWMDMPLDSTDYLESLGAPEQEVETPVGELPTIRSLLAGMGRYIGENVPLGAEGMPEDPTGEYRLTPEILETLLPLTVELAAYPTGVKTLGAAGAHLVEGIEGVLGAAARGYERAARPVGEAYRLWYSRNVLPGKLAKSSGRLATLGEEAVAGVEWWRDVNEAQKLATLDEVERNITHTLDWIESSVLAEDEMAMDLAIGRSPQTPRPPGPGAPAVEGEPAGLDRLGPGAGERVEGRVGAEYTSGRYGPFPEPTPATMERISTHEPLEIPGLETTDPYAYMEETTARKLAVINQRRRATINSGMNRAKMRATAEEKELLNELESAGVDFTEADRELSIEADRFDRLKKRFEESMRANVPPKLVTEIHDKTIPELIGDPRYTQGASALAKRRAMAASLNEGLPVGSQARITAEEIANAGKDPNLREKMAKLMARRIRNKAYYKNKEQGFMEMSLSIRLGEMGIGAVTGGAMDEENRLRGAIIGGLVAFTLGTVLRYGRGLGQRGAVGPRVLDNILRDAGFFEEEIRMGVSSEKATGALAGKVFRGSDLVPVTEEMIAAKQAGLDEMLEKLAFARRELPKYKEELIGTSEAGKFLWGDTRTYNKSDIIPQLEDQVKQAQGAVDRYTRQAKRASESILGNERGTWNIRQMQERIVREAEIEGPEMMRQPEHTRAEAKTRGARRDVQKKMFGKARSSGMGDDGLRAWIRDTYGKGMSEMTEAEMVLADQDLTRRIALSGIFPEEQLDRAVMVRNVEDAAIDLHGRKAQKKIDSAVRKVTGQHRDLSELNEQDLTSVLEILPKRFLRTRGLGALIRQPLAVEDVMNRMGSWGKYITRQIRRERNHTDYLWSKWYSPLKEEIKGLTGAEMDEIVAALHPMEANGRQVVMPQDPKLQNIALRIRQDLNEIGNARAQIGDPVRLAGGGTRPFEMMDNYYPLHIPPEEMTSSILIKRRIIEHLIETGQAAGPSEALDAYQRFIKETITNRFGNLDYAREAWIEPEKFDLLTDLSRYYYGSAKRISRHQYYGSARPGGELPQKMHDWLNGLRQDVGPDEFVFAQNAMKRHFKHEAVDDAMSDTLKRLRSFETIAHMGLAQIMNASEPVHTAVFAGFHNFAKGFARAIRGTSRMDAREIVARNAAAVGSTIRDLFGESGGAGSLTGKFLKITGFSPIEKWNRKLASHVGIQYIESTVAKLQRNPGSVRLRRMLDEMLINSDDVLRNGLSEEDLIKGAMELSNRTQKRTGVIDMPMFMSHPMGRIVAMFKTFAYGSARLMTRDFLMAAGRNPERLLRLLVAFPIVGEIVGDVRNLATGNIRDTEGLARLAENYAYVGTMGILYDFMRSVQFGEGSIQAFMTGPVGSDIAGLMSGTHDWLLEGKGRKLGKQALRMLPPPLTPFRGKGVQKAIFGKEFFPPTTKKWQIP